jgi:hypothetical protein
MNTSHDFSEVEEQFVKMTDFLQSHASNQLDLSGIEAFLAQDGRTLLRHLLNAHVAKRGVGDIGETVLGSDGIMRTHKRLRTKTMKTLFGPIMLSRLAYSTRHVSLRCDVKSSAGECLVYAPKASDLRGHQQCI